MVKHTRGPWTVQPSGHITKDGQLIAAVKLTDMGEAGDANARLIAAAPELLAALQEIATHTRRSTLDPSEIVPTGAATIARAAIAKATGGAA